MSEAKAGLYYCKECETVYYCKPHTTYHGKKVDPFLNCCSTECASTYRDAIPVVLP